MSIPHMFFCLVLFGPDSVSKVFNVQFSTGSVQINTIKEAKFSGITTFCAKSAVASPPGNSDDSVTLPMSP